jgi:hypothetical protein
MQQSDKTAHVTETHASIVHSPTFVNGFICGAFGVISCFALIYITSVVAHNIHQPESASTPHQHQTP